MTSSPVYTYIFRVVNTIMFYNVYKYFFKKPVDLLSTGIYRPWWKRIEINYEIKNWEMTDSVNRRATDGPIPFKRRFIWSLPRWRHNDSVRITIFDVLKYSTTMIAGNALRTFYNFNMFLIIVLR